MLILSKRKRDEAKREAHIERGRAQRESAAARSHRSTPQKPKRKSKTRETSSARKKTTTQRRRSQRATNPRVQATPTRAPQDEYNDKLSSMRTQLTSLAFRTRNLPESVNRLDNNINTVSDRIERLRENRIAHLSHLVSSSRDLVGTWSSIRQSVEQSSLEQRDILLQRQNSLESSINIAGSLSELSRLAYQLSDLNRDIQGAESLITGQLNDYSQRYGSLDRELREAEETVVNLENTSIDWKQGEYPILAVQVQDLTNDAKGVLTLSNQRILFEEVTEEVLRRNLLFTTEKKTVHRVTLDQPIGSIDVIEKGRVGFFKGAGLYIRFKPQTGVPELKLDTTGDEDTRILQKYNYIVSGEVERDLGLEEEDEEYVPVVCPNCSAPYREEILLGETMVKCIYCGTVIKV